MGEDLRLEGVSVDFAGEPGSGKQKRRVLDIPEFSLEAGDMAVLEGPSGTGKTTFLRLVSGILLPDKGSVRWNGLDIGSLPAAGRDAWRGRHIGWDLSGFLPFRFSERPRQRAPSVDFHPFQGSGETACQGRGTPWPPRRAPTG